MTKTTFGEYLWLYLDNPEFLKGNWRQGQTIMNVLWHVRPDLYEMVTGTDADCFYDNKKVNDALVIIEQNW